MGIIIKKEHNGLHWYIFSYQFMQYDEIFFQNFHKLLTFQNYMHGCLQLLVGTQTTVGIWI